MTCIFFGHRDTPCGIEGRLREAVADLIEHHQADTFYVGNQGRFDIMVRRVLRELKLCYPQIRYAVALAYLPDGREGLEGFETVYPEGLERTPVKYAIDKRNRWMIEQADYVVTYVRSPSGGAAKWKELAEKKGKVVLNLAGPAPLEKTAACGGNLTGMLSKRKFS